MKVEVKQGEGGTTILEVILEDGEIIHDLGQVVHTFLKTHKRWAKPMPKEIAPLGKAFEASLVAKVLREKFEVKAKARRKTITHREYTLVIEEAQEDQQYGKSAEPVTLEMNQTIEDATENLE